MFLTKKTVVFTGALCLIFGTSAGPYAEDNAVDAASKYVSNNVKFTGYGSYEFGEVEKGDKQGAPIDHFWSHEVHTGLGFMASLGPKFELVAGIEGKMWNPYPNTDLPGRTQWTTQYSLWLNSVYGTYSPFAGSGNSWLEFTGGYFPYKYNPDARNFGEYVFRSYTYPGILMNYFDFPAIKLLGFKVHANLFDDVFNAFDSKLKSDLLITEEDQNWPIGDISISWFASLNFKKMVELGAGVDWANCISVNSFNTAPPVPENMVILSEDALGGITYDSSHYYSFRATKPMARVNIDPKPLLGDFSNIFGQEDLKLYSEACIIGLKNYPFYYEKMSERMPITFGFNFPTFKVLDLLNIELEHYSSRLSTDLHTLLQPPNSSHIYVDAVPVGIVDYVPNYLRWKWSLYVKKTVSPRVSIILQCAHDHYRLNYPDGSPVWEETLTQQGDWHWIAELVGAL